MKPEIVEIIRFAEQYVCITEINPYAPIDAIKYSNETKLLEAIKPYIKTQTFKRYKDDSGYMESRLWLPYIKDALFKKLEIELELERSYNSNLQKRINSYSSLSWFKKLFGDV